MNTNVECIYKIVEEIKQNITDNQYKIIMDNLMVLNREKIDIEQDIILKHTIDQVCFLYQCISFIEDDNIKQIFTNRIELLDSNLKNLFNYDFEVISE